MFSKARPIYCRSPATIFDIVIFCLCPYLCDREDLFRIASAVDTVLRMPGWVVVLDFFSPVPRGKAYRHCPSVQSYKMDYRSCSIGILIMIA
jgi:hypothetical protein